MEDNEVVSDCFQCKMIGTVGSFGIGSYLTWNIFKGKKTIAHKSLLGLMATGIHFIFGFFKF